jgi:GT2 family glycosyltransferase
LSPNDSYPEHVVTAVIVAHDGAEWLPHVVSAVLAQTFPVHRIVAVDTGSRDRSGAVLAGLLGQQYVLGMDRESGYAEAVALALRHAEPVLAGDPDWGGGYGAPSRGDQPVEWIWLLHDDCEPAQDALAELLKVAHQTPGAAVLGPKVLDWSDRRVILEAGLAIDTAGRRVTGTEPREIDQGQHDGDRDVLAVSSAGMLVRRDVWTEVGGFDPELRLFRDDVDFCWRVHAAGYRVRLVTDAIVYHIEASGRGRRQISAVSRPRRADRRNALIVLLANLPLGPMFTALAGNVALSVARIIFFLLAKRQKAAQDEAAAFGELLRHPALLPRARYRRARGRRRAYAKLRSQIPRGRSLSKLAEFVASTLSPASRAEAVGMHHASDDPSDDDFLLTDSGLAQRILTNPGVVLFTVLLVIALVSERSLLGAGPLGGGALLPVWGGASGLWGEYLAGFHAVSIGSAASTPPYVAVIAAVSTILAGKPWLAVAVIMLGSVPLAGVTAYLTSRQITSYPPVRVWLAVSYALLPVATGAVAAGRLGTAVVFILMPLIASAAGKMLTQRSRRARRAAWRTGLLIALAAAFVPLVWAVAIVVAALAVPAFGRRRQGMGVNLAIVALVPPVLLAPWTLSLVEHPSMLLLEVGLQQSGLASRGLSASSLVLLSPGGPGLPPDWVTGGLLLAALVALLLRGRGIGAAASWGVALCGLLVALAVSRVVVTPASGGAPVPAWPGDAMLLAAVGLLLAAATAAEPLRAWFAAGGGYRIGAGAVAVAACATPLLAAGFWLINGVRGPVGNVAGPVLPEFVSISSEGSQQLRTLVLRPGDGTVSYEVLRGTDPPLGAAELAVPASAANALERTVAALTAPNGSDTGDQGQLLAEFDIGYVLLPAPIEPGLVRLLDGVVGMRPVSQTPQFALWRVTDPVARARVVEPDGAQVELPSGTVGVTNATAPPAGGTLVLAEPFSGSWHATLDGRALAPAQVYGWAQGFRLPPGGGELDISRAQTGRGVCVALEFVALVVVGALALPGAADASADAKQAVREEPEEEEEEFPAPLPVPPAARRGARGRDHRSAGARSGRGKRGTRGQGRRRRAAGGARRASPGSRRARSGPSRDRDQDWGPELPYDEYGEQDPRYDPYRDQEAPYDEYGEQDPRYDQYRQRDPRYDEYAGTQDAPYDEYGGQDPRYDQYREQDPRYQQNWDARMPDEQGAGYDQPGYDQPGYDQRGYDQRGYDQPGHGQPGYDQPGYDQPEYDQRGHDQPGYDQPGYDQPGYDQPGYDQPGYDQPGYNQPGYNQHWEQRTREADW